MKKEKNSHRQFLPKAINLLLKEERPQIFEKAKKIANIVALSLSLVFLLTAFFTLFYFWFLSSYDASLENRADQAKQKISSLAKVEKTYLSLIKKIEEADKILNSRGSVSQFLKEVELLLPSETTPFSLNIEGTGEVNLTLSVPSLTELENLNGNLKKAINEGKILSVEIRGITKEEGASYKLGLSFRIEKSED